MRLVPFDEWSLRGIYGSPAKRTGRARAAVVHHAVTDIVGDGDLAQVREVDDVIYGRRIESHFSMVAYNYLVTPSGAGYTGRGLTWRNGANNDTKGTGFTNANTVSICCTGNYEHGVAGVPTLIPTDAQLRTIAAIVLDERAAGLLAQDSLLLPHNYVHATSCCGDELETRLHIVQSYIDGDVPMATSPYSDLKGDALEDFLDAVRLDKISDGKDPNDFAERDEAIVFAKRALNRARGEIAPVAADVQSLAAELAEIREQLDGLPATQPPSSTIGTLKVTDATGRRFDMTGPITIDRIG